MLLFMLLIVCAQGFAAEVKETKYTDIQPLNQYCDSPLKTSNPSVKKIVCNFRNTAARLGSASAFKETMRHQGGDLYLEINNCSKLLISSAFHGWRDIFSSLHLAIENVDDVVQEETISQSGDVQGEMSAPGEIDHESVSLSDFISFTLRNSKMDAIFPPLISDTKALLLDIHECSINTVSENAFRNVHKMWQFRILKSNISRIANRAMPELVLIAPPPAGVQVEWAPFILNETNIEVLESDAIQLNITEKDEHFNIVHSKFMTIRKRGLRILGTGHVLIADSLIQQIQNDSVIVMLRGTDSSDSSHKIMDYSTLTIMGLEIYSVDVANFLFNLQITNGKLYLFRINFRFSEALPSIIHLNNKTVPHIWDQNQTTFVERWTVICSCYGIESSLNAFPFKKNNDLDNGIFPTIGNNFKGDTYDYEDAKPTETSPKPFSSPSWHILNELRCYQDGLDSISLVDFDTSFCPDTTTSGNPNSNDTITPQDKPTDQLASNIFEEPLIWYLGATGVAIFFIMSVVGFICIFRHQRKTLKIDHRKMYRPNNVKQVGVISEDPICGCEEGEEESQL